MISTLAVDGWTVTFGTARRGRHGRAAAPPRSNYELLQRNGTALVSLVEYSYYSFTIQNNIEVVGIALSTACQFDSESGIHFQV